MYLGVGDTAKRIKRSRAWVKVLARSGRIEGAIKISNRWIIPIDWQAPTVRRGRPKKEG